MIDENAEWISAIGEIGLDGKYTQDESVKARQKKVFHFFLALAEEKNLPVVVHSRRAISETLDSLASFKTLAVLMHWYDGEIENLPFLKERGYMISIGPAVLYSPKIIELAQAADIHMILTETDGPVAFRGLFGGQQTKPSFVVEVASKLAELKAVSQDNMRSTIFSNFQRYVHD
jgi:TatD DNase family protein